MLAACSIDKGGGGASFYNKIQGTIWTTADSVPRVLTICTSIGVYVTREEEEHPIKVGRYRSLWHWQTMVIFCLDSRRSVKVLEPLDACVIQHLITGRNLSSL